jgi:hypothetical protein
MRKKLLSIILTVLCVSVVGDVTDACCTADKVPASGQNKNITIQTTGTFGKIFFTSPAIWDVAIYEEWKIDGVKFQTNYNYRYYAPFGRNGVSGGLTYKEACNKPNNYYKASLTIFETSSILPYAKGSFEIHGK